MDDLSARQTQSSYSTGANSFSMTRSDEPMERSGEPVSEDHRDAESSVTEGGTLADSLVPEMIDAAEAESSPSLEPAELIRVHQRGVWRYLRMLGCDEATADDLTQETFLRVLRRTDFVQHNENATAGYLRRTAYNLLVSRHR
ncbi:MAG: sigma-70 family RNA polymerase sigma factor, partial [Planctomycetota bacterium]